MVITRRFFNPDEKELIERSKEAKKLKLSINKELFNKYFHTYCLMSWRFTRVILYDIKQLFGIEEYTEEVFDKLIKKSETIINDSGLNSYISDDEGIPDCRNAMIESALATLWVWYFLGSDGKRDIKNVYYARALLLQYVFIGIVTPLIIRDTYKEIYDYFIDYFPGNQLYGHTFRKDNEMIGFLSAFNRLGLHYRPREERVEILD